MTTDFSAWLDEQIARLGISGPVLGADTLVFCLIKVLWPHSDGLARKTAIAEVRKLRAASDETVQSAFNGHRASSSEFHRRRTRPGDDLFRSARQGRFAIWSLNRDRARAWAERRGKRPD